MFLIMCLSKFFIITSIVLRTEPSKMKILFQTSMKQIQRTLSFHIVKACVTGLHYWATKVLMSPITLPFKITEISRGEITQTSLIRWHQSTCWEQYWYCKVEELNCNRTQSSDYSQVLIIYSRYDPQILKISLILTNCMKSTLINATIIFSSSFILSHCNKHRGFYMSL